MERGPKINLQGFDIDYHCTSEFHVLVSHLWTTLNYIWWQYKTQNNLSKLKYPVECQNWMDCSMQGIILFRPSMHKILPNRTSFSLYHFAWLNTDRIVSHLPHYRSSRHGYFNFSTGVATIHLRKGRRRDDEGSLVLVGWPFSPLTGAPWVPSGEILLGDEKSVG